MKLSLPSALLLLSLASSTDGLSIPGVLARAGQDSLERQLYNRNAHVIIQEPIARAQKRADEQAAQVRRGEYRPPHHPKYRPTGTAVPPLETGHWDRLALVKRKMEERALEDKVAAHEARASTDGAEATM
ncbi:protein of unknown function [Taphrina deformans PYCC 5710]|uniref:Uncharacterized protein n=1 Tax=Taphrina deformans (strain PYCC 5710 / ATCC 11124 / CBS 356.35 / IMI 108563 / JCM 9778 / NBRC 8474) TaxID=1097556 RepID=R4XGB7_TAPDE|nr:protein of unknown function [Taphrina deformans PYCC 5710]|eukprot:CCG84672.1 protein of unknown function [Taphrina deformans PYCC 5710]